MSDEDSPYGGPDGARLALTGQAARNVAMLYGASGGDGDTEGDLHMHSAAAGNGVTMHSAHSASDHAYGLSSTDYSAGKIWASTEAPSAAATAVSARTGADADVGLDQERGLTNAQPAVIAPTPPGPETPPPNRDLTHVQSKISILSAGGGGVNRDTVASEGIPPYKGTLAQRGAPAKTGAGHLAENETRVTHNAGDAGAGDGNKDNDIVDASDDHAHFTAGSGSGSAIESGSSSSMLEGVGGGKKKLHIHHAKHAHVKPGGKVAKG